MSTLKQLKEDITPSEVDYLADALMASFAAVDQGQ
jgi:hypothetical protein